MAAIRKVSVERYVEQVRDGISYMGFVKIDGIKFDFEMGFVVPIERLNSVLIGLEPAKDVNEVRRFFWLTMKRDNADIILTAKEYVFFLWMLVELVLDLYNHPMTRTANEVSQRLMTPVGVLESICITSNGLYDFQPELCEILSAPKFGCSLFA